MKCQMKLPLFVLDGEEGDDELYGGGSDIGSIKKCGNDSEWRQVA